ncbi:hypothetical protein Tco_0990387 [Tanacetum coccineum]|uniref:Uncharacterized protein n=1 Tax=Tanacetum coccineum TaxID=301880 RepID=A0ABQ5EWB7_9ASTR
MLRSKRAGKEQQQESSKKQIMEEDKESDEVEEVEEDDESELKKHLVIKKDEDIAIDAIPLATKLPVIIDYKLHKEAAKAYGKATKRGGLLGLKRLHRFLEVTTAHVHNGNYAKWSPPSQPPPLPPPAGASGALATRQYESAGISRAQNLSPTDSLMQDDSIPDEQVHLSNDEDSENDHLSKADSRKD